MSTSFFVVPSFTPPTLEQLTSEPDEVSLIVAQEAKVHQELTEVREYNKHTEPLGVIAAQEELSEQEGLSDAELTEEEEDEDEDGDDDLIDDQVDELDIDEEEGAGDDMR